MSKEKNHETPEKHEPVKRAPERKSQPAQPAPRRRGFLASVFSHLAVAAIAVIGVGSYIHWNDILNYTGSRVCAYNVLGQYAKSPVKVPPIDLKKAPETTAKKVEVPSDSKPEARAEIESKTQAPNTSVAVKTQSDAVVAPQSEASTVEKSKIDKPEKQVKTQSFTDALQAARKQFWQNDKAAVTAYEDLVKKQPENADLRAEMANVYYKNGAKEKAVQAFFEAGRAFLADKNIEKAKAIGEVLKRVSPQKSAEFSKLLNSTAN